MESCYLEIEMTPLQSETSCDCCLVHVVNDNSRMYISETGAQARAG
jgi:hypothetical protein